jgi:hypothetical protein
MEQSNGKEDIGRQGQEQQKAPAHKSLNQCLPHPIEKRNEQKVAVEKAMARFLEFLGRGIDRRGMKVAAKFSRRARRFPVYFPPHETKSLRARRCGY